MRSLTVIGAPSAAGAYGPGQDLTPGRLREAGLLERLTEAGFDVVDDGDTNPSPWVAEDPASPDAISLDEVVRVSGEVADRLRPVLDRGDDALVIGGDCTIAVGVVSAAVASGGRVGIAYVDRDADLNVPATSDGRFDWMGVAHLLDLPGALPPLSGFGPRRPLLEPADVRYFCAEYLTDAERGTIAERELHVEGTEAIRHDLDGVLARTRAWAEELDLLIVHVDTDVLDSAEFPVSEEIRPGGGLTYEELAVLLTGLNALPPARVLTVTEINLDHTEDPADAADRVIALLTRALGTSAA